MVFAPGWLAAEPFVEFAPAEIAVTLLEELAHALVESLARWPALVESLAH
jgi:hypothetical protein